MSRWVGELPVPIDRVVLVVRTGGVLTFMPRGRLNVRTRPSDETDREVFVVCVDGEHAFSMSATRLPECETALETSPARRPWWKRWFA